MALGRQLTLKPNLELPVIRGVLSHILNLISMEGFFVWFNIAIPFSSSHIL